MRQLRAIRNAASVHDTTRNQRPSRDAPRIGAHSPTISAAALLKRNPRPSSAEIKQALDRNLCRCGSQNRMVRAVLRAASEMATG